MPSAQARLAGLALRLVWRRRWLRPAIAAIGGAAQRLPRGGRVEAISGPVQGEWLLRPGASEAVLYYLHGGGFIGGSPAGERALASRLAAAAGTRAFSLGYRLAPQYPFPAAVEDTMAGFRRLVKQGIPPNRVLFCGVSAGGGLALAALVALREAGDPLPAGCVLLSPFLDLTLSGTSFTANAGRDPLLRPAGVERAAALYIGAADRRHPFASPLFADLRGLPPLMVHTGTSEVLLSDSERLAEKAKKADVDLHLHVWPGLFHVFPVAGFLPESRKALQEIREFARRLL